MRHRDVSPPAVVVALLVAAVGASCGETRGTLVTTGADAGTWRPEPATTWQIQLDGSLDTSIDVALYEIDPFETSDNQRAALRAAGRRVLCYVSVGTFEPSRDDAGSFPAGAIGTALPDYPGERWVDPRDATIRALMTARLQAAKSSGCHGVDLSNVSPGAADTGFGLQRSDVLDYGRFLAAQAHQRDLAVGLGGSSDVADALQPDFDLASVDGCLTSGTCAAYAPFATAGKAVLAVEFGTAADAPDICARARQGNLNVIIKNRSLDAFRVPCP